MHNEELQNVYSSARMIRIIASRRMRWAGNVVRMGEKRKAYGTLVCKPEGKRLLGRPRHRCVNNIKMDHRRYGGGGIDWAALPQNRVRWRALVNM
jgi:hypothetical protein